MCGTGGGFSRVLAGDEISILNVNHSSHHVAIKAANDKAEADRPGGEGSVIREDRLY